MEIGDPGYQRYIGGAINDEEVQVEFKSMSSYVKAKMDFAEYFNNEVLPQAQQRGFNINEDTVQILETQMVGNFGVDLLVAKYALIQVDYRSIDAALDFIFGDDVYNDYEPLQHRFFGYTPEKNVHGATDDDPEQICFVCEMAESRHRAADSVR